MAKRKAETMRSEHLACRWSLAEWQACSPRMDRRRICDGSEELRTLKERLHMAKVNKARQLYSSCDILPASCLDLWPVHNFAGRLLRHVP